MEVIKKQPTDRDKLRLILCNADDFRETDTVIYAYGRRMYFNKLNELSKIIEGEDKVTIS